MTGPGHRVLAGTPDPAPEDRRVAGFAKAAPGPRNRTTLRFEQHEGRRTDSRRSAVYERKPLMSTFLVVWNPKKWFWDPCDRATVIKQSAAGRPSHGRWSVGGRKYGITPVQDRVFLLRQGPEPRGIIASGWFRSTVYQDKHWDGTPGKRANYADISWDLALEDCDLLPLALLKSQIAGVHWHPQGGGVLLVPPADVDLERLWASHTGQVHPGPKKPPKRPKP